MSEFARSTTALDAAIAACNSPEDIRELSKASLESQGIITRNVREDGQYGARVTGRQPEQPVNSFLPEVRQDGQLGRHMRRFYIQNDVHDIYADSVEALDQRESTIRASLGGSR